MIEPGFAISFDITPNPRGATRIPVCHPYPLCEPFAPIEISDDRTDATRDAESTGV